MSKNYMGTKTKTMQNATAADADGLEVDCKIFNWALLTVTGGGTVALDVVFECRGTGGTWVACGAYLTADHSTETSTINNPSTTATGYHMAVTSYAEIRARVDNFSTGTVTVVAELS